MSAGPTAYFEGILNSLDANYTIKKVYGNSEYNGRNGIIEIVYGGFFGEEHLNNSKISKLAINISLVIYEPKDDAELHTLLSNIEDKLKQYTDDNLGEVKFRLDSCEPVANTPQDATGNIFEAKFTGYAG